MIKIRRRDFLKSIAIGGAVLGAAPLLKSWPAPWGPARGAGLEQDLPGESPDLIVAEKGEPAALVQAGLAALGGIEKFVKKGDYVVIKPNVAWARTPQQACNTNPEIVYTVARLCREAGAGRVEVWDHTCDDFNLCFSLSGIKAAAEKAGAKVFSGHVAEAYREVALPGAKSLQKAKILKSVLDCNVLINLPVIKVHYATGYTASMKNFIGANLNMSAVHATPLGLHQGIADIATLIKPTLIVADALRVLTTNGPKGPGKLLDVGQVLVGVDPVAMDAYGAGLIGRKAKEIPFILFAHDMGLGEMDINKIKILGVGPR
jgi:uncharacterized protein (DUF362 family)